MAQKVGTALVPRDVAAWVGIPLVSLKAGDPSNNVLQPAADESQVSAVGDIRPAHRKQSVATTYYLLSTTHYTLSTTHHLLLTTYCSLLITYYSLTHKQSAAVAGRAHAFH